MEHTSEIETQRDNDDKMRQLAELLALVAVREAPEKDEDSQPVDDAA